MDSARTVNNIVVNQRFEVDNSISHAHMTSVNEFTNMASLLTPRGDGTAGPTSGFGMPERFRSPTKDNMSAREAGGVGAGSASAGLGGAGAATTGYNMGGMGMTSMGINIPRTTGTGVSSGFGGVGPIVYPSAGKGPYDGRKPSPTEPLSADRRDSLHGGPLMGDPRKADDLFFNMLGAYGNLGTPGLGTPGLDTPGGVDSLNTPGYDSVQQ